ncbi:hypothetical protein [Methylobacterium soli]|uniref:Uncharacterized protein n=1 Tax=Methylobacterium soli TaxID=553447 RepID=A0A6L3SQ53_9HYPH|nr:hypothetical protein [Methylobacterium soli]KAB1070795.1 hypothetical protein F6X53_29665 [Methylobacterium soli]GJE42422.1 hypothetical protein AEGHOMDF_1594 [Methylobacterium soli]
MTSTYERRIRRLEAHHKPVSGGVVVLGVPGQPEPSPDEISRASHVLRVSFIAAKNGRPAEGENHASR